MSAGFTKRKTSYLDDFFASSSQNLLLPATGTMRVSLFASCGNLRRSASQATCTRSQAAPKWATVRLAGSGGLSCWQRSSTWSLSFTTSCSQITWERATRSPLPTLFRPSGSPFRPCNTRSALWGSDGGAAAPQARASEPVVSSDA